MNMEASADGTAQQVVRVFETVRITNLVLDDGLLARAKALDPARVKRYVAEMRRGDVFPPILVNRVNGRPVLLGGRHRIAAYRELGIETVEAFVVEVPYEQAGLLAWNDNRTHGLSTTRADRLPGLNLIVKARAYRNRDGTYLSSRKLADMIDSTMSHNTLLALMKKHHPRIFKAMSGGEAEDTVGTLHPLPTDEEIMIDNFKRILETAVAASQGVLSPGGLSEITELTDAFHALVHRTSATNQRTWEALIKPKDWRERTSFSRGKSARLVAAGNGDF